VDRQQLVERQQGQLLLLLEVEGQLEVLEVLQERLLQILI